MVCGKKYGRRLRSMLLAVLLAALLFLQQCLLQPLGAEEVYQITESELNEIEEHRQNLEHNFKERESAQEKIEQALTVLEQSYKESEQENKALRKQNNSLKTAAITGGVIGLAAILTAVGVGIAYGIVR